MIIMQNQINKNAERLTSSLAQAGALARLKVSRQHHFALVQTLVKAPPTPSHWDDVSSAADSRADKTVKNKF